MHMSYNNRYIPNRKFSQLLTFDKINASPDEDDISRHSLLVDTEPKPTFNYKPMKPSKENTKLSLTPDSISLNLQLQRPIAKKPFKVLDAPCLQDDFYLSLVDWSVENTLSVGLGSCVYIWDAATAGVSKLCDLDFTDSVASVSWSLTDSYLSVGTATGSTLLYDVCTSQLLRSFPGHKSRVGTMAWNGRLLTTGSRDRQILHRDIRAPDEYVSRLMAHRQEVCGLRWSFDDQQLSSGGNDNNLMIWNLHSCLPVSKYSSHIAAVKALAWSPYQFGLLASGGGTADRSIKCWNTLTGELVSDIDTGSQVCNLMFSKNSMELVSTHGYSLNSIILWKYPKCTKLATLEGHSCRVLYLAMSPDGTTIVSGAGDETLRFWDVFPNDSKNESTTADNVGLNFLMR